MIAGIRLSELAIGSPLLSTSWEYKGYTGKEAVKLRLKEQFQNAGRLGFKYIIDTIRPNITSKGRLTLENNGINGDIWTFDERMECYHQYAKEEDLTVVLELEFTVQVTENNVDEYARFILSSLIAKYSWVRYWSIGVNPDKKYSDGTYNCSPQLYVYLMNEIYRQIKLFDHNIQVGGPGLYESIDDFLQDRSGWLAESCGELYTQSSDYLDIGPNGFLQSIDFFTFQGKQETTHYAYNSYGSIIANIRALIYEHLGDNVITLFSTSQGHQANFSNNTALMNQSYYDIREILQSIKNNVIPFKNELVDAYPDTTAYQGHFDGSRLDYGIMRWAMITKPAYTTYKFIFDAVNGFTALNNPNNVFEENDNLDSITFKKTTEGLVYNVTIIWSKTYTTQIVSLLSASFLRSYQLENNVKTSISDNIDITLLPGKFLVIYDEIEELEVDKEDIRLNIERRLRYQREINDQMVAELPSSYNKEVTDTNIYKLMRAVAVEMADASMILTMIKEDLYLDTAREDAIYENFGTLVKLQKRNDWTYDKYKKLVRGVMASLLQGPTYQSIVDALSLFTNFKISIGELYKENVRTKYADIANNYNPMFSFIIELEKPLEDESMTQEEIMEDTAYVLKLIKPAHTLGILVIILTGSERWDTYYAQRYGIDWHDMDGTNLTVELGQGFNEGTFGWKHINYPGNIQIAPISDSVVSNAPLTNNSALIGPRYVLADHSMVEIDDKNNELYDLSVNIKDYISTLLQSTHADTFNEPLDIYSSTVENAETRFGYQGNKYLQLAGKSRKTLNDYLLGTGSSLKDENLIDLNSFNEDRYMFSNLLKAIRFSNNYGFNAQFANNIDVITQWQEYLKEHSFREKVITSDGQTVIVERLKENNALLLEGFNESNDKIIEEQTTNIVGLYEDLHIPDDPLTSFRLNYPRDINLGLNNHKLGINLRREKVDLSTFFNEVYNTANDYLAVAFGFELVDKWTKEIKDSYIDFAYDNMFIDEFSTFKDQYISLSIPTELKTKYNPFNILSSLFLTDRPEHIYQGELVTANDFLEEFGDCLDNQELKDLLQQVFNNDVDDSFPEEPSNLILKLNLLREHPLLKDKSPLLDKWINSIHGALRTPINGIGLRRKFIKKNVEKYTIGCGLREEYLEPLENNKLHFYNKSNDFYDFNISENEDHYDTFFSENVPVLDYLSLDSVKFNKYLSRYSQSAFSISKTVLTELKVDTFFENYNAKNDNSEFGVINYSHYDFDINESINNGEDLQEDASILDYSGIVPYQFGSSFNKYRFTNNKTVITEWHPYYTDSFNDVEEKSLWHLYKTWDELYKFDIYENELTRQIGYFENYIIDRNDPYNIAFNQSKFNNYKFSKIKQELIHIYYDFNEHISSPLDSLTFVQDYNEYYKQVEETDTWVNSFYERFNILDEDKNIRLNQYGWTFIGKRSNLITFYIDNFNEKFKNVTGLYEYIIDSSNEEQFKKPEVNESLETNIIDEFILYDDENSSLTLNKTIGKFIKYRTAIHSFSSSIIDYYLNPIADNYVFTTTNNENEYFITPEEVDTFFTDFADKFILYDDENKSSQLNKFKLNSTDRLIRHKTAIYSFYNDTIDKYVHPIHDAYQYTLDINNNDKFNTPDELNESTQYFSDSFILYDNENNALTINKAKLNSLNTFIKYQTAIYSLENSTIDYYTKDIYESTSINVTNDETETFNIVEDLLTNQTYFSDSFILYDDENDNKQVNRFKLNNNKLIKWRTAIYSFNPIFTEYYNHDIYESINIDVSNNEKDEFKPKQDNSEFSTDDLQDNFILYDDENSNKQINKFRLNNGKFIKYRTAIYSLNPIFTEYCTNIYESIDFNSSYNWYENFKTPDETHQTFNLNIFEEHYIIYDENDVVHTSDINDGQFLGKKPLLQETNLQYFDYYHHKIYERTDTNLLNYYSDNYQFKEEQHNSFDHSFSEQFVLYDDENSALKLNSHIGKFIKKRTAIHTFGNWFKDNYSFNIDECNEWITDNINQEIINTPIENIKPLINEFNENYIPYDEGKTFRLNLKRLNRYQLIKKLGSLVSFYTPYYEKWIKPNESLQFIIDKPFTDSYQFNINSHTDINEVFTEQFIMYDEDKAIRLNNRRGYFIGFNANIINTYSEYKDDYKTLEKTYDLLIASIDTPFTDSYSFKIHDDEHNYINEFKEHIDLTRQAIVLNKRRLNQTMLIGNEWEKCSLFTELTDYYDHFIYDNLLNNISLSYSENCQFNINEEQYVYLEDSNIEQFNDVLEDNSLNFNNDNSDKYHEEIFDTVLNHWQWLKEEYINIIKSEDNLNNLFIDQTEIISLQTINPQFRFTYGQFNQALNVNRDINEYIIELPNNNDKFNPQYDINHQDIFNFNKDVRTKDISENNEFGTFNKDKYPDMNKSKQFTFSGMQLNCSHLATNDREQVKSEVYLLDKYVPKPEEQELQKNIRLSEKIHKPKLTLIMGPQTNIEHRQLQQQLNGFKFAGSLFTQQQFHNPQIENQDMHETYIEQIRKPKDKVKDIYRYLFKEKINIKSFNDNVSNHNTYFNNEKFIFNMNESIQLDTTVNKTDLYELKSAVAYMKLEKELHGQYLVIRKGTYV